jgi:hypothetical protein
MAGRGVDRLGVDATLRGGQDCADHASDIRRVFTDYMLKYRTRCDRHHSIAQEQCYYPARLGGLDVRTVGYRSPASGRTWEGSGEIARVDMLALCVESRSPTRRLYLL